MTEQGKPDRCPSCGSYERGKCNLLPTPAGYEDLCCDDWHSSPVPAAAPQQDEPINQEMIRRYMESDAAKPSGCVSAPQPTNRHGERVSRECGAGHHAECKETLETCHCTYRGLHKTMHVYATFPGKPSAPQAESVPSGKEDGYWRCLKQATDHYARKIGKKYQFEGEASIQALMDDFAERSNSLLRERITAAEGVLKKCDDIAMDERVPNQQGA